MTREEAITNLNMIRVAFGVPVTKEQKELVDDTFEMAIQALSQEPCTDAVSREAVIKAVDAHTNEDGTLDDDISVILEDLPPVTQKPNFCASCKHNTDNEICLECEYDGITRGMTRYESVTHKSGKWIEHPEIETSTPEYLMFYKCSECGDKQCFCKSDINKKRFCSNCGAKMESEANNG